MARKSLAIGIIILFLFCNISFTTISDENSINLSGKTLYVGGNGPGNYTKIQEAIDNASDGDTVFVYSGTYYGTINVHKSIILQGQDKYSTILDGGGSAKYIIVLRKDNTQIIGLTIRNAIGSYSACIYTDISSNNVISDNIIEDAYYGIDFKGDYHYSVKNSTISNCLIRRTSIGIYALQSNSHNINNNKILNNTDGIVLIDSSINDINNNVFENNIYGIKLIHIYYLEPSRSNEITYNSFIENSYGIFIDGNNYNNHIRYNNFIGNIISLSFIYEFTPVPFPTNKIEYNYWDRSRVLPKLILGLHYFFIPFPIILWFNLDLHPAQEPYDIPVPEV